MVLSAFAVAWLTNRPIELESSSIRTVQYSHWNGTLVIRFQSGDAYRYFDVPRKTYRWLMQAESHGAYFYREIRRSGFKFEKLKQ